MSKPFGLILAGGAGRRLGGVDKAFVTLWGRTMLDRVLDRLRPQCASVAISAGGDTARFAAYGLDSLDDGADRGKGPLAGLAAGLAAAGRAGAATMLTIPVDTPFIPADLAQRLAPAPSVATSQGQRHHLVALWPVSAAPVLRDILDGDGPYRVVTFAERIGARPVAFDDAEDPFLNVNTKADLDAAEARLAALEAR